MSETHEALSVIGLKIQKAPNEHMVVLVLRFREDPESEDEFEMMAVLDPLQAIPIARDLQDASIELVLARAGLPPTLHSHGEMQ